MWRGPGYEVNRCGGDQGRRLTDAGGDQGMSLTDAEGTRTEIRTQTTVMWTQKKPW